MLLISMMTISLIMEISRCMPGIGMAPSAKHFVEGDESTASDLYEYEEGQNSAKGSVILSKGFFCHFCSSVSAG